AEDMARHIMRYGQNLTDGFALSFTPPAITGMSTAGGFEGYIQSRSGASEQELYKVTQDFIRKCEKRPELSRINSSFSIDSPQVYLELDREKARSLGVKVSDVFDTIGATFGVSYVNDITLYGRTFSVRMQADAEYRSHPEDLREMYVQNSKGGMVPLASMISLKTETGPLAVEHMNGFKAAKITGSPAPGYSSGQGLKALQEVANELPEGFALAWSGQSYQEKQASGSTALVFALALIMAFMVLAALYESFSLPMAVLTAVPFAVFGALLANLLRGLNNDIYFQVALVTLVGLGAKNAILIVEFAIEQSKQGMSAMEAAVTAARLRFRPVVMTSLAFILGCLPLALSHGAGAGSRHAIGTAVVGGMIAATLLTPLFVPFFYRFVVSLRERFRR
ncbi:MAG: efflux RND transporter permease subunit, partial [Desulfovibrio sp.]|nr:efflux RND transporter permease subunit [Desulfovibrio sp.]